MEMVLAVLLIVGVILITGLSVSDLYLYAQNRSKDILLEAMYEDFRFSESNYLARYILDSIQCAKLNLLEIDNLEDPNNNSAHNRSIEEILGRVIEDGEMLYRELCLPDLRESGEVRKLSDVIGGVDNE